jgi:SAM-dependent methyltransferase
MTSDVKDKWCPVCKRKTYFSPFPYNGIFKKFYQHGFVHSPFLFETLNLENYKCANCGANDRDRLMALYLEHETKQISKDEIKLLDFAPSKALQLFLKNLPNINYRSADLLKQNVDDNVDMTSMDIYENNRFDIFICSHILEHIEDDLLAMKELYRITKPGGFGLCLVPILLNLKNSIENEEYLVSKELRWKYFGQDDHVRMYSKQDFVKRLESVGFKVEMLGENFFGKSVFEYSGLDFKSVLYVVRK